MESKATGGRVTFHVPSSESPGARQDAPGQGVARMLRNRVAQELTQWLCEPDGAPVDAQLQAARKAWCEAAVRRVDTSGRLELNDLPQVVPAKLLGHVLDRLDELARTLSGGDGGEGITHLSIALDGRSATECGRELCQWADVNPQVCSLEIQLPQAFEGGVVLDLASLPTSIDRVAIEPRENLLVRVPGRVRCVATRPLSAAEDASCAVHHSDAPEKGGLKLVHWNAGGFAQLAGRPGPASHALSAMLTPGEIELLLRNVSKPLHAARREPGHGCVKVTATSKTIKQMIEQGGCLKTPVPHRIELQLDEWMDVRDVARLLEISPNISRLVFPDLPSLRMLLEFELLPLLQPHQRAVASRPIEMHGTPHRFDSLPNTLKDLTLRAPRHFNGLEHTAIESLHIHHEGASEHFPEALPASLKRLTLTSPGTTIIDGVAGFGAGVVELTATGCHCLWDKCFPDLRQLHLILPNLEGGMGPEELAKVLRGLSKLETLTVELTSPDPQKQLSPFLQSLGGTGVNGNTVVFGAGERTEQSPTPPPGPQPLS